MSILAKFTLAVLLLLLVAVSAVTGLALKAQYDGLRGEAIERGRAIARNLAAAGAEALLTNDPLTLVNLAVDAKSQNSRVVYAALTDKTGRVVSHSTGREALGKPLQVAAGSPIPELGDDVRELEAGGETVWDIGAEVVPKGTQGAIGRVHVALSQKAVLGSIRAALLRLVLAAVLLLALGGGLSVLFVRVLVKPLRNLADAARRVGGGELDVRVPVPSRDEVGQLMSTFNQMVDGLGKAEKEKLEKERMASELNIARTIQANLLPTTPPKYSNLEVAFHCNPAKELGGDFYDWFPLQGGAAVGLVIADVSGKGVPAALHMANMRNLTRFASQDAPSPAEALKRVNAHAWPDLKGESFVTMMYASVDVKTHEVTLVSAGHEPALWVKAGGSVEAIRAKGMPIGVAEPEDFDFVVKDNKFKLAKGDLLVLYTDGVTEAMNAKEEQFGREAVDAVVAKGGSAAGVMQAIIEAVQKHAGGHEQSDDLTLLVIKAA